ncbi:hypothetical protein PX860_01065 [Agrobacterium leguminum]|uniref:hypothetical protein n=1 Tax=Agrobacterium TaxID=357 RepID=UPI00115D306B|nr:MULTISPECIES: hypothetical protein [Agrobacterium]WLD97115.1 hypothetical protein PX860_01065 [Agrobacterium leguminum]
MGKFSLTEILAVYAALLSTAVFFWNIFQSRGKVRVKILFGIDKVNGDYVSGLSVAIQNPSSKPVRIVGISLLYPYRRVGVRERILDIFKYRRIPRYVGWCYSSLENFEVDDKCPVTIEPGDSHHVLIPQANLDRGLKDAISRHVIATVQDALWRNTASNTFIRSERKS